MSLDRRAHDQTTARFTSAGREASFAPDLRDVIGPTVEESSVPLLFSADGDGDAIPLAEEVDPSYSATPVTSGTPSGQSSTDDAPRDVAVRTRSLLHGAVASRRWAIGLTVLVAVAVGGVAAVAALVDRDTDPRVMVAGSSVERDEPEVPEVEWPYVEVATEVATTEMIGQPMGLSATAEDGTSLRYEVDDDSGLIQVFDVVTPPPGGAVGTAEDIASRTFVDQRATVMGPPVETELGEAHDYWAMVGTDRVEGRVVVTGQVAIRLAVRTPADIDPRPGGEALRHQIDSLAPASTQPR